MENATEILILLLGGGGVGIGTLAVKALKDRREGRTAREDTAITRWKELAGEREAEKEKAWGVVAAYRRWYPSLWAAYVTATADRETFPADPTQAEK